MNHQERNWLDIPSDVMENILNRIGKICKSPVLWRVINMNDLLQLPSNLSTAKLICKHAMVRSQGQPDVTCDKKSQNDIKRSDIKST
ncbi:hypothetical protein R6Q57_027107 [Mikania cordata]